MAASSPCFTPQPVLNSDMKQQASEATVCSLGDQPPPPSPPPSCSSDDNPDPPDVAVGRSSTVLGVASPARTQSTCLVCGDQARGFNFGVVTCESCKAFFRRTAVKTKMVRCVFSGQCAVTMSTRSFCAPCRLDKCLAVGMHKELILSAEAKARRQEKIEKNRKQKLDPRRREQTSTAHQCGGGEIVGTNGDSCCELPPAAAAAAAIDCAAPTVTGPSHAACRPITHLTSCDCSGISTHRAIRPPSIGTGCPVDKLAYSLDRFFNHLQSSLEASDLCIQRRLVSGDEMKLESLCSTYCNTIGIDPAVDAPAPPEGFTRQLFARRVSNLMRRLIRFAKETAEFASLPLWAQIRLLRGAAMPCILLLSAELLDVRLLRWKNDGMSLEVLKQVPDHNDSSGGKESSASTTAMAVDFFSEHFALTSGITRLVPVVTGDASSEQCDRVVFALLQRIELLSPEVLCSEVSVVGDGDATVNCCSIVSDAQQRYVSLLLRHLQAAHSFRYGADTLPDLLLQLGVLKRHASRQIRGFRSCSAVRDDPLLKELFRP